MSDIKKLLIPIICLLVVSVGSFAGFYYENTYLLIFFLILPFVSSLYLLFVSLPKLNIKGGVKAAWVIIVLLPLCASASIISVVSIIYFFIWIVTKDGI